MSLGFLGLGSQTAFANGQTAFANGQTPSANRSGPGLLFTLAIVWVACASAYDAFLVYKYREGIEEQNPICDWLIQLAPNSTIFFLIGKALGTLLVIGVLIALRRYWRPVGQVATLSLVAFQVGLMTFIHSDLFDSYRPGFRAHAASVTTDSHTPAMNSSNIRRNRSPNFKRRRFKDRGNRSQIAQRKNKRSSSENRLSPR